MKKILLLGGAVQQVVALKRAKELGYKTILCDRAKDNPAREFADLFYQESIKDKEAILEIAKKEKVDGVISYASDVGVVTASYVADCLALPTSPYVSVEILSNKDLFRSFLRANGFNTPLAKGYSNIDEALSEIGRFKLPVMVKPVDSAGSRGVSIVSNPSSLREKIEYALTFSLKKRFIIEEYVEMKGQQISGDAISIDGKLKALCLGKAFFNKNAKNPFVPFGDIYPYGFKKGLEEKIKNELQRLLTKLKMKSSVYNLEIRVDKKDNIYLMEVAPRNGGNYIPKVFEYATSVPMVEIALKLSLGEKVVLKKNNPIKGYWSNFSITSSKKGILKDIIISEKVRNNIVEKHIMVKNGSLVNEVVASNSSLGILIMKASSDEELVNLITKPEKWLKVVVE
jgi:biotin carboxylase